MSDSNEASSIFNIVMSVVELVVSAELGPEAGMLLQAATQLVSQEAFNNAVSQNPALNINQQSLMQTSFAAGMTAATGLGNPSGEVLQLAQQYVDQARASAALANSQQQLTDQMQNVINALMAQELQSSGSGSGSSSGAPAGMNWLQAIAYAMGIALGNMANKLANESQNLQSLSGSASGSGAQQFEAALAQFQADSQVFSMLENAFSTAIKALGEGNTTMASRT